MGVRIQRYLVMFHVTDEESTAGLGDRVFEAVEALSERPERFSLANMDVPTSWEKRPRE